MDELLKEVRELKKLLSSPREIILPRHQYIPSEARSIDWRSNCKVEKNSPKDSPAVFVNYKAGASEEIIITNYALFTDAENADEVEFFFDLNGRKQLADHGRPYPGNNGYDSMWKLNIGVAPDLSNASLIPCYIIVKPNDVLRVTGVNLSTTLDRPMGVRLVGYRNSVHARHDRAVR